MRTDLIVHTVEPTLCWYCQRFFAQYACTAALGECDCPRCQGLCECNLPDVPDDADRFVAAEPIDAIPAIPEDKPFDPDAAWAATLAEAGLPPEQKPTVVDEIADLQDRLVRMKAEFDNYRGRVERERDAAVDAKLTDFIGELLTVADDLERGMRTGDNDEHRRGYALILQRLRGILQRRGIEPFVAAGRPFDPNVHQAVVVDEVPDRPSGIVSGELATGYRRGDTLIRPAMVRVTRRV